MKPVFFVFLILLLSFSARAQKEDESVMEYYVELGNLLPDQIEGVTEIQPMWGLGVGLLKSDNAMTLQYINSTARGIKINAFSFEGRKDIPLSSLVGTISGGVDLQGIQRPGSDGATYYGGAHVGGGILALVSSGLYVRMNMKFTAGPGVSLFLGFGFTYRPSEDLP